MGSPLSVRELAEMSAEQRFEMDGQEGKDRGLNEARGARFAPHHCAELFLRSRTNHQIINCRDKLDEILISSWMLGERYEDVMPPAAGDDR